MLMERLAYGRRATLRSFIFSIHIHPNKDRTHDT